VTLTTADPTATPPAVAAIWPNNPGCLACGAYVAGGEGGGVLAGTEDLNPPDLNPPPPPRLQTDQMLVDENRAAQSQWARVQFIISIYTILFESII